MVEWRTLIPRYQAQGLTMLTFTIKCLVGIAFIIPHIENTPIENVANDDLSVEYEDSQLDETETEEPVYANV